MIAKISPGRTDPDTWLTSKGSEEIERRISEGNFKAKENSKIVGASKEEKRKDQEFAN
jgi:hypothetical protein